MCDSFFSEKKRNQFFMSLHHVSSNKSKNINHKHFSLTGTDHCNSKLFKGIQFEKNSP